MPSAFGVVTYRELEFPNYLCIGNGSNVIRSNNIHVDNRVVRGNTFASIVLTANQKRNKEAKERESATTRLSLTKKCSTHRNTNHRNNNRKGNTIRTASSVVPPVDGRHHMELQTDTYIEDIMDHLLAERCTSSSAQTTSDSSWEEARPNSTPYYSVFVQPAMTEDKGTQLNDNDDNSSSLSS